MNQPLFRRLALVADAVLTLLVGAGGVFLVILAVRSVGEWSQPRFEFPPAPVTTLAHASGAFIAFLITWARLQAFRLQGMGLTRVTQILGDRVEVTEGGPSDRAQLRRLGGKHSFVTPWSWSFSAPDELALARLLTSLRDAGVAFEQNDPAGWSPSAVFASLRSQGLVSGSFNEISGSGGVIKR